MGSSPRQCAGTQCPVCQDFLTKHKIAVLQHPPYSPDPAPCDFFLFPKIKSALKGTRFESVYAVKAKATELMNKL